MTFARRMTRLAAALIAGFAVALLAPVLPAWASHSNVPQGAIEVESFSATPKPTAIAPVPTQAGSHPNMRFFARFCDPDVEVEDFGKVPGCTRSQFDARLRDYVLRLPPGMLGNPQNVVPCAIDLFLAASCPNSSQIGYSFTVASTGFGAGTFTEVPTALYVVQTMGLEPARLGTGPLPSTPPGPMPITIALRTDGDYGIDSTINNLPIVLGSFSSKVMQIDTVICGLAPCLGSVGPPNQNWPVTTVPLAGAKPFFVIPTSCKPAVTRVQVDSWQAPGVATEASSNTSGAPSPTVDPQFTPTGCDNPATRPKMDAETTVTADSTEAGKPSGYEVAVQYSHDYANDAIWPSALRHETVTMPDGVTLAPGGGIGLEACSRSQFGIDDVDHPNNNPVRCPKQSEVGDVKLETPILANGPGGEPPLSGKAFFGPVTAPGRPTPDKPWKLFLLLEGRGLRIKLVGNLSLSPSGQITTTFENQPEAPFSRFELHTRGGDNAVLANPTTCAEHQGSATLVGWSGDSKTDRLTVTPTSACPSGSFHPTIDEITAEPSQAGANSTSRVVMSLPDGDQLIKNINLSLPPGATGSLAAVPLCPAARAATGDCDDGSKIGSIKTTVGTGNGLLTVPGIIYLGEPVQSGDAASFVIVVPAKVGPIDLGKVVEVNRVRLRSTDTGVDVLSADITNIFEGASVPVRKIDIVVDRDNFFRNPTSCATQSFVANFISEQGKTSSSTVELAATGCDKLPFAPKLRLIAGSKGRTKAGAHPPLDAILTQVDGEASIKKASVVLPDIIRPNVPQFLKPGALCNGVQLASRTCPALSQVGSASVITPLLPFKLSGPVYIVLKAGSPLPSLAVFLRGHGLEVVLNASNGFSGIRIVNTFDALPDVPSSRFELNVKGGPNGILNAFSDLCKTSRPKFNATFTGHNGKTKTLKPRLEREGCVAAASSTGVRILSRTARISKRGVAKIKLRCIQSRKCSGRLSLTRGRSKYASKSFSIRAGKTESVTLKLRRKARSAVVHRKGVRARAKATVLGARSASKTVMLKAPRRKR